MAETKLEKRYWELDDGPLISDRQDMIPYRFREDQNKLSDEEEEP